MQSKKREAGLIALIVVLVIVVLGGIYLLEKNQEPISQNSGQENQAATSSATVGWKTYTDTQYGFTIQYPAGWTINGPSKGVIVSFFSPDFSYVSYGNNLISNDDVEIGNGNSVNGPDWVPVHPVNPYSEDQVYGKSINFKNPGIQINEEAFLKSNRAVEDLIVSTFKFTQSSVPAGWRTYTNSQYGFSIQYPDDWDNKISGAGVMGAYSLLSLDINKYSYDFNINRTSYVRLVVEDNNFELGTRDWKNFELGQIKGDIACSVDTGCELVFTSNNGQNFLISTINNPETDSTTNQMLSTFKFTNETADWNTYDNFGIQFEYPSDLGNPQESFYNYNSQELETINFSASSTSEPFGVSVQQFNNPQTGAPETFDQMISRFVANDQYIDHISDISANGLAGKEIFYNSAVDGKLYARDAFIPLDSKSYISFSADYSNMPEDIFSKIISSFKLDNSSIAEKDPSTRWLIYKNNGVTFEYPEKFNTDYASLNLQTMITSSDDSKIDAGGCYSSMGPNPTKDSKVIINNIPFCLSTGGDVGAGQL